MRGGIRRRNERGKVVVVEEVMNVQDREGEKEDSDKIVFYETNKYLDYKERRNLQLQRSFDHLKLSFKSREKVRA